MHHTTWQSTHKHTRLDTAFALHLSAYTCRLDQHTRCSSPPRHKHTQRTGLELWPVSEVQSFSGSLPTSTSLSSRFSHVMSVARQCPSLVGPCSNSFLQKATSAAKSTMTVSRFTPVHGEEIDPVTCTV